MDKIALLSENIFGPHDTENDHGMLDFKAYKAIEIFVDLVRNSKVSPKLLSKDCHIPLSVLNKLLTKGYMKDLPVEIPSDVREQCQSSILSDNKISNGEGVDSDSGHENDVNGNKTETDSSSPSNYLQKDGNIKIVGVTDIRFGEFQTILGSY